MRKDLKLCSDSDTKFLIRSLIPVWSFIFPFLAPEQGFFIYFFFWKSSIHQKNCFVSVCQATPLQSKDNLKSVCDCGEGGREGGRGGKKKHTSALVPDSGHTELADLTSQPHQTVSLFISGQ